MHYVASPSQGLGGLEDLARGRSWVHQLDARAKLIVTLGFILTAVSFDKYALAAMAPLALYPVVVFASGGLPAGLLWRLVPALPFVLLVGAANPWFDRQVVGHLGPLALTGGWVSFASIAARLALTLVAGLTLVATTGIGPVCVALERLGAPRVLTTQIQLMVRYLAVLMDEGARNLRAHRLRGGGRGVSLALAGPLAGQWLLRTLDRAHRVHLAMLARGFDGAVPSAAPPCWSARDTAWLAGWCAFFLVVRLTDPAGAIGRLLLGGLAR